VYVQLVFNPLLPSIRSHRMTTKIITIFIEIDNLRKFGNRAKVLASLLIDSKQSSWRFYYQMLEP